MSVFVVTCEAHEAPNGPALTVLAFVEAGDEAAAGQLAVGEVEAMRWTGVRALRIGEIVDEAALPEDFRDALANARRYGSHLIIYDEP